MNKPIEAGKSAGRFQGIAASPLPHLPFRAFSAVLWEIVGYSMGQDAYSEVYEQSVILLNPEENAGDRLP
jgi:hypothetical protein